MLQGSGVNDGHTWGWEEKKFNTVGLGWVGVMTIFPQFWVEIKPHHFRFTIIKYGERQAQRACSDENR